MFGGVAGRGDGGEPSDGLAVRRPGSETLVVTGGWRHAAVLRHKMGPHAYGQQAQFAPNFRSPCGGCVIGRRRWLG